MNNRRINFSSVNEAALAFLPMLVERWLPGGHRRGREYVALNPRRLDRSAGSFKVNLRTGRWADFATGDSGGDPISLRAYIDGIRQGEAARRIVREMRL